MSAPAEVVSLKRTPLCDRELGARLIYGRSTKEVSA